MPIALVAQSWSVGIDENNLKDYIDNANEFRHAMTDGQR